ncbi:hypothetical protein [Altererythrobacter aquiaggeris]|uniref:hypothetical protein n=1 Tax=Aestuarierythrobacter aquiaggeris TaxID=1898396 RepID=UPI003015F9CF
MKKFALLALPLAFAITACNGPNEEAGEEMDEAMGTDGVLTDGPMEEKGEAMDDAMGEKGEAMEEAGEATGNEAMEEKGDDMEDAADGM